MGGINQRDLPFQKVVLQYFSQPFILLLFFSRIIISTVKGPSAVTPLSRNPYLPEGARAVRGGEGWCGGAIHLPVNTIQALWRGNPISESELKVGHLSRRRV